MTISSSVKILLLAALAITAAVQQLPAQNISTAIKLNQLGFYPHGPKVAIVTDTTARSQFFVMSTNLRDTLLRGMLSAQKKSPWSLTTTRTADFSMLSETGSFVLFIPGLGHSYVFEISDDAGRQAAVSTLKGFYFQRVSMPLEEKYAGKWHRSAGHPDDKVLIHSGAVSARRPEGSVINAAGGWYDAGDYNKYIVNSGITMGTILSAYEDFPDYFGRLATNIPESGDAVPDVLNEAIYNLRWMLLMQDPNDGGVYNKCTNAAFDGMVIPGITRAPRYVVKKYAAATLDFAAVTAQAARLLSKFKKQLPGLADSCLRASRQAWSWSLQNPAVEYNQTALNAAFKPVVSTGAYGDRAFTDEWFWASVELYATTRKPAFGEQARKYMPVNPQLPSWANVAMLGIYSAIRSGKDLPLLKDSLAKMKSRILSVADGFIQKVPANAFGTIMGQSVRDFNWGSNSNAANQGILLINAYLIGNDKKYVDFALTNLDYLLGRNATGYCFVTGLGSKSPMFPHHRTSTADGITDPVPGLLAGGPNPGMQDKCKYEFTEPETAYSDLECSYASNEIAINWNAPMVYLANAIEALKQKVGYVSK